MKRHHRAMAASARRASEARPPERVAEQIIAAASENTIRQRVNLGRPPSRNRSHPREERATPSAMHTLVLIGELDHASTHTLEAEIERLCEQGISAITLDLSKLSGIDSAGVAVIAFRSRWCRKRGCELSLIPGGRSIQRAFELAGLAEALAFKEGATAEP
jgi:anti-sigma B factor antagonist